MLSLPAILQYIKYTQIQHAMVCRHLTSRVKYRKIIVTEAGIRRCIVALLWIRGLVKRVLCRNRKLNPFCEFDRSLDLERHSPNHLRNECLFFFVHGEWIRALNKQIALTAKRFSSDLFVPRWDSFPLNQEIKTLIPYMYKASNKDPF